MKLTITHGSEIELRDEQGRLAGRCYDVFSKTERDPNYPDFRRKEITAEQIAAEIVARFNR